MAPGEATLLSDLSAVYAERARAKSRPEDYVISLEMAERAVAIRPNLPEVVFNRALALEHLFLFDLAREGWRRYLAIDDPSPWASEARARLEKRPPNEAEVPSTELQLARGRIPETLGALSEEAEVVAIENRRADFLQSLGQPAQAWQYRYRGLAWASRLPAGQQLHIAFEIFEGAARDALRMRHPESALAFQDRALAVAEALRQPEDIVHARLKSSRIKAALGRQEEAKRDFVQALRALERVPPGAREPLAARLDVARRDIEASEDRVANLASEPLVSQRFDAQASFEFQRGNTVAAEDVIRRGLAELEDRRANVSPGAYRVSFFDQARPYFERMVALQLNLGKLEVALEVLERFRARTLLDQIDEIATEESQTAVGAVSAAPLNWQDLCRRLPEHTVIVVYAVVEGRLVTWLVRHSGIRLSPVKPDWTSTSASARRLEEARTVEKLSKQLLENLHKELIEPWKGELRAGDRIIFVPTRDLFRVPFAALIDSISGRFLVQDHVVGIAPSASEFVAALERDRKVSARPIGTVLLVGDPSPSSESRSAFSRLPGSTQEILHLRHLYQELGTRVLTQAQATSGNVLDALGGSDVVHLSAHALKDPRDPARSGLVLSPSEADPGELTTRDLVGRRLPRTRLVVLASCGSNSGPVSESEGSLSLAHSFLTAGVPAVVGSLWLIDDRSTTRLSVRFHQELLRGTDALAALRTAQLAEIAESPALANWTWASFQVFGGVEARNP